MKRIISVLLVVVLFTGTMYGCKVNNETGSSSGRLSNNSSSEGTVSQQNAVRKAKSYLEHSAFSRQGLIIQLEYEGFSNADAVYGADKCGANWNEQATKSAKTFLDYRAFTRQGLIDQLEYVGFTHEQAVSGVNANGL